MGNKKEKHYHTHSSGKMSPTYISWVNMKQRCLNRKHNSYNHYGGRGITVCNKWINSFIAFLNDMGERPNGTSLDKIDNDGNYCKENCRWATRKEQQRNTTRNCFVEGIVKAKYLEDNKITRSVFDGREKMGWSKEEIINGKHIIKIGERSHRETNFKELKKHIMEQFKKNANIVKAYLSALDERERETIEKRLGIIDGKRQTLEEIGKEFGLSRERIRQIEFKALKKMSVLESEIKADKQG